MNVITPVEARHPFLTGKAKRLFIDGKWVEAASGKTFETHNPSTGELLASVAEGDREDIDRAVEAARRAFNGPWRKFKPFERQNLLLKLADLVDQNFEELATLDTLDMGAPISRTKGSRLRAVGMLRYYAGQATSIHGETIENSLPGEYVSFTLKEPVGVVGADADLDAAVPGADMAVFANSGQICSAGTRSGGRKARGRCPAARS